MTFPSSALLLLSCKLPDACPPGESRDEDFRCAVDHRSSDGGSDTSAQDPDGDRDNDGLTDWDESSIYATDPDDADTDDDSFSDGDEVASYGTNPNNAFSRPYAGKYNVGACDEWELPDAAAAHPTGVRTLGGLSAAVYLPGDLVGNVTLVDQYGESVDLWSFCGRFVDILFLQTRDVWGVTANGGLRCWVEDVTNLHRYYRDYGYQLIVVITRGSSDDLPSPVDVAKVVDVLDLPDVPVLASTDETLDGFHTWMERDFHTPTLVHVGPGLGVHAVDLDDCTGADRDPCPYMEDLVPASACWDNAKACELEDVGLHGPYCACPAPACQDYCDDCPIIY